MRGDTGGLSARALVVLLSGTVVAVLAWVVRDHEIPALDPRAFGLLALSHGSWLADPAKLASEAAPALLGVVALAVIVALGRRRIWREPAVIACGFLLCELGAHLTKTAAGRPRPSDQLIYAGGFSFPSTSSALCVGMVAVAAGFARLTSSGQRRALAFALAWLLTFAAGVLFVAIRVHYLSDVIAGWAFGIGVFTLCDLVSLYVWRAFSLREGG